MKALLLVLLLAPLMTLTGCLKDDADGSVLYPAYVAGGSGTCSSPMAGGVDASGTACPTASGLYTRYEYVVDNTGVSAVVNQFMCNVDPADVPANKAEFEAYAQQTVLNFGQGANCISGTVDTGPSGANSKLLFIRAQ